MRWILLAIACLVSVGVQAVEISGRVKVQANGYDAGQHTLDQALGFRQSSEREGQLRVAISQTLSNWRFKSALLLDARNGTSVQRDLTMASLNPALALGTLDTSYWNLTHVWTNGGETLSQGRIDRLNVSWTGEHLVLRLGRQALTWGSGLVFHPMDLVNPFEPVATDTVYKPGTDMAYGQWLFDDGSDVQFAAVLRRRRDGASLNDAKNTYAMLVNVAGTDSQWKILIARNRTADLAGAGVSHSLGSAVWNGELIATQPEGAARRITLLSNLSWATVWHGDNVTLFAEYYRNGFGEVQSHYTVAALNPELVTRLRRGDLFVTGRDYLSVGMTLGVTPLMRVEPTFIVNLRDRSSLLDIQATWSLSDNTLLKAGIRVAMGARGTEFTGLQLAPSTGLYLASPDQAFLRLSHFFQWRP